MMDAGLVSSGQAGIHPRLDAIVRKHLASTWSQPLHRPSTDAWRELQQMGVFNAQRPLILDSGCGTGESTRRLAGLFPGHLVIGVDRSLKRLGRGGAATGILQRENYLLLRSELATFWRLMLESGYSPERHYLFYPNPWPKSAHLMRRWHAHPVFPVLLALGGEIELRCNWEVYAQEFARAAGLATGAIPAVEQIKPDTPVSPFERKYHARGQTLYVVRIPASRTREFRLPREAEPR
jgi:tRNA (guanine-N7-)-methyltransferase